MKVWFKLQGENSPSKAEVKTDADVDDLKRAIKDECPSLQSVDLGLIAVFAAGSNDEPLFADLRVSDLDPTTARQPIVVVVEERHLQVGPLAKKMRVTAPFDAATMVESPFDVFFPSEADPSEPAFVCSDEWKLEVELEIQAQIESADAPNGSERVPPMAVVRCSRGGKTRSLYEIARMMRRETTGRDPIAVILVSFNDFSSLLPHEHEDPLQALCQRIAFTASRDRKLGEDLGSAFEEFQSRCYSIDPDQIRLWLGDHRVLLLIDELNNLSALTDPRLSTEASLFGKFAKQSFLRPKGRYLIFSSHVLSTVSTFGEFIDPSGGSFRHVTLQELPLVDDLSTAMDSLNNSLDGAREAIYYGLMPGMIYETGRGKPVEGKRELALQRYLHEFTNKVNEFKLINRSLITGDLDDVPARLHILLDGCGDDGSKKIRWVPFHLQYVMEKLGPRAGSSQAHLAAAMATLCRQLLDSKERSGDGWEGLFVLFLLARSIAGLHDEFFMPEGWFVDGSVEVKYNPYRNTERPFSQCKNWEQLKEGIFATENPTISIFYPSHAQFKTYDALAVYSRDRKIGQIYGYQLKEGMANPKQPIEVNFAKSFVIRGSPPTTTVDNNGGWSIPNGAVVDTFLGTSGMHWTPQRWCRLSSTCGPNRSK